MMADDWAESAKQQAQQAAEIIVPAVTDKVKAGAGAMMDIMKGVASMPASALANHFMHGNHQASLATLQRQMGGDLHPLAIAPELERYLKADLRRRGVNFSLEKAPDGNTYVHFSGRDVDTVQHGLKQAAARYERRVSKFDSKAFKREVKARKKVNKVMNKQNGKVSKSLAKSQKAAVKATNAQVKANKARYKANKQLGVIAQSSPEKRARAIKKYMRLNGRANKKQLKANAKSVKARSASMNFWQTQYRANDKISRAQYKALTRIDRVRKWRMKKLKQSFNQALPQPMPQQGLPGQPMPQPVNQPMPGQPVPQQGLPQQPFPHSRSRASTFTGPGQRAPQPMPQPVNQPVPGQPMPQQSVPQPMPGQPVPGQPVPQQGLPGQPMPGQPVPPRPMPQPMPQEGLPQPVPQQGLPGQPVPPQPMPQPVPEPVPPRPMPQPMPQEGLPGQALPGQPMPQQSVPQQGLPQQSVPQQGLPGQPMPQPVPGQAWLTPEVLSQVPSQPMPQQPVPGQQALPQPVNQPVPGQAVPGQQVPFSRGSRASTFTGPGQPKYSKADVTKAMDQRKQQILEEAKKAKPTRTPTHSKGAR